MNNNNTNKNMQKDADKYQKAMNDFLAYDLWRSYQVSFLFFDISSNIHSNTFYFKIGDNKKQAFKSCVERYFKDKNNIDLLNRIFKTSLIFSLPVLTATKSDIAALIAAKINVKVEDELITISVQKTIINSLFRYYTGDILEKINNLVKTHLQNSLSTFFKQISNDAGYIFSACPASKSISRPQT